MAVTLQYAAVVGTPVRIYLLLEPQKRPLMLLIPLSPPPYPCRWCRGWRGTPRACPCCQAC